MLALGVSSFDLAGHGGFRSHPAKAGADLSRMGHVPRMGGERSVRRRAAARANQRPSPSEPVHGSALWRSGNSADARVHCGSLQHRRWRRSDPHAHATGRSDGRLSIRAGRSLRLDSRRRPTPYAARSEKARRQSLRGVLGIAPVLDDGQRLVPPGTRWDSARTTCSQRCSRVSSRI